jgi:hypothetical protein
MCQPNTGLRCADKSAPAKDRNYFYQKYFSFRKIRKLRDVAKNNAPGLRRILVRIQGALRGHRPSGLVKRHCGELPLQSPNKSGIAFSG